MDPVTAALVLATEVVRLITLIIQTTPEDVRAERARIALEDLRRWQAFVDRFRPKEEKADA